MSSQSTQTISNPFTAIQTDKPLVALCGARNGYIMLATSTETLTYDSLPDALFAAARAWAIMLEQLGAPRVYWITLSEVTRHLHVHLFPRWPEDPVSGIPLFDSRETVPQPEWTEPVLAALAQWSREFQVETVQPQR